MGTVEISQQLGENTEEVISRGLNLVLVGIRMKTGCTMSEAARYLMIELREYIKPGEDEK